MSRLLKKEDMGGGRTRSFFREGKDIIVQTSTDAQKLVDQNRRSYADAPKTFGKGDFHKVAEFTADVLEATAKAHGIPWGEFINNTSDRSGAAWAKLLNDRDTRAFRTRPGYVDGKKK